MLCRRACEYVSECVCVLPEDSVMSVRVRMCGG